MRTGDQMCCSSKRGRPASSRAPSEPFGQKAPRLASKDTMTTSVYYRIQDGLACGCEAPCTCWGGHVLLGPANAGYTNLSGTILRLEIVFSKC